MSPTSQYGWTCQVDSFGGMRGQRLGLSKQKTSQVLCAHQIKLDICVNSFSFVPVPDATTFAANWFEDQNDLRRCLKSEGSNFYWTKHRFVGVIWVCPMFPGPFNSAPLQTSPTWVESLMLSGFTARGSPSNRKPWKPWSCWSWPCATTEPGGARAGYTPDAKSTNIGNGYS
jgi:hypothetical protein